jgi:hypothetical protein
MNNDPINLLKESQDVMAQIDFLLPVVENSSNAIFMESQLIFVVKAKKVVIKVCRYLKEIDLDIYSGNDRGEIYSAVISMKAHFDSQSTLRVRNSDTAFSSFETQYNAFVKGIGKVIPLNTINDILLTRINDVRVEIEEQRKSINSYNDDALELMQSIAKIKDEVEVLLTNTKNASQEIIVAKFGTIYEKLANKHKTSSRLWLTAIAVLIVVTALSAYRLLNDELKFFTQNVDLLQHTAGVLLILGTRLVIFASLFVAIGICIRNFKANKHNEVINRHRQNALNTFETFVLSSGEDKTIKDAILMEVTRTIFSSQNSGFSSADIDAESPSKIIEIIKNVGGKE